MVHGPLYESCKSPSFKLFDPTIVTHQEYITCPSTLHFLFLSAGARAPLHVVQLDNSPRLIETLLVTTSHEGTQQIVVLDMQDFIEFFFFCLPRNLEQFLLKIPSALRQIMRKFYFTVPRKESAVRVLIRDSCFYFQVSLIFVTYNYLDVGLRQRGNAQAGTRGLRRRLARHRFFHTDTTVTCVDTCTDYLMLQTNSEFDENLRVCLIWCFLPTEKVSNHFE